MFVEDFFSSLSYSEGTMTEMQLRYLFSSYRVQHPQSNRAAAWILPFLENPLLPFLPASLATLHSSAELSPPSSHTRVAVIAFGNKGLGNRLPTWGKPHCCHGNRGRAQWLPGSASLGRDGGGRWEVERMGNGVDQVQVPPSQCCSVVLGTVASERHTSWTCRAGFLLLIEERVFWNLN